MKSRRSFGAAHKWRRAMIAGNVNTGASVVIGTFSGQLWLVGGIADNLYARFHTTGVEPTTLLNTRTQWCVLSTLILDYP